MITTLVTVADYYLRLQCLLMKKENRSSSALDAHCGRITRARAAAFRATGGLPPLPSSVANPERKQSCSKRRAHDENSYIAPCPVGSQCKKRAVLKDVTNTSSQNASKAWISTSKVQTFAVRRQKSGPPKTKKCADSKASNSSIVGNVSINDNVENMSDVEAQKLERLVSKESSSLEKVIDSVSHKDIPTVVNEFSNNNDEHKTIEEAYKMKIFESKDSSSLEKGEDYLAVFKHLDTTRERESTCTTSLARGHNFDGNLEFTNQTKEAIRYDSDAKRIFSALDFIDIDTDPRDPQLCCTYASEIYTNQCVIELVRRPVANYMETLQRDVTQSMRAILIDWLVEVSEEYKLVPDTLYLTVHIIDEFLSQNYIERQRLQLLGITCMLVASTKGVRIQGPDDINPRGLFVNPIVCNISQTTCWPSYKTRKVASLPARHVASLQASHNTWQACKQATLWLACWQACKPQHGLLVVLATSLQVEQRPTEHRGEAESVLRRQRSAGLGIHSEFVLQLSTSCQQLSAATWRRSTIHGVRNSSTRRVARLARVDSLRLSAQTYLIASPCDSDYACSANESLITCPVHRKYEEICAPRMEEFCFITDNTYTKEEVLEMESQVLNYLGFKLSLPTTKTFLRRFLRAANALSENPTLTFGHLANYLAELTLVEYSFLKFLPSVIAASAVFLARWTLQSHQTNHPWNSTLEHYTCYKATDLKEAVLALRELQMNSKSSPLNAIREKYNQPKFERVATLSSRLIQGSLFL
ncbi:hypothetical protein ZIOFF_027283 [Zingiber officinale]|uniref:B-like cyclin n=1 Tax=Zingiber officinale TaxID=94328 RepID=A0A8J5GXJ0_ZINOF|nr:hypothetical protein ZIOFF_027283 [Zingiber officinale]